MYTHALIIVCISTQYTICQDLYFFIFLRRCHPLHLLVTMALQCPFRLLNRHFKLSPGEKKVEDWKIARERLLMEARRYSMKIKV